MEDRMNFPCLRDFKFVSDRRQDLYYGKGAFSFWCELQVGYLSF